MENQTEDKVVCYIIIRQELGMSIGKTAAQVGHGVQYMTYAYLDFDLINGQEELEKLQDYQNWLNNGITKIVLKADEKEWAKLKEQFKNQYSFWVVDAGKTELKPNTETCVVLWPMKKSMVPKLVKRLQVLK